jgi:hypothetical protein
MQRYTIETISEIPFRNGIYIFFEKGEKYGELDRIVRVGTDNGQNQLISRLKQHLVKENKDRSVFRKNIGRAILSKTDNPLISYWNIDFTTKKNKELFYNEEKAEECKKIEKQISEFMNEKLSFVVFPIQTKEERLRFEKAIISSLYNCADFTASENWLGNYVPETRGTRVKKARMWLSQGLRAKPLTDREFAQLSSICQ